MDESSEDVAPLELREGHAGGPVDRATIRCDETKTTMRSVLVVVTDVELHHALEVVTVGEEQMVETLAADGADPPFRIRVGHRSSHCLDAALDLFLDGTDDADVRLMTWASLEGIDPDSVFGPSASLDALARILTEHASATGEELSTVDARIAAALVAMLSTAWRVLGPVARSAAGLGPSDEARFDDSVLHLLRRIAAGDHRDGVPGSRPVP